MQLLLLQLTGFLIWSQKASGTFKRPCAHQHTVFVKIVPAHQGLGSWELPSRLSRLRLSWCQHNQQYNPVQPCTVRLPPLIRHEPVLQPALCCTACHNNTTVNIQTSFLAAALHWIRSSAATNTHRATSFTSSNPITLQLAFIHLQPSPQAPHVQPSSNRHLSSSHTQPARLPHP